MTTGRRKGPVVNLQPVKGENEENPNIKAENNSQRVHFSVEFQSRTVPVPGHFFGTSAESPLPKPPYSVLERGSHPPPPGDSPQPETAPVPSGSGDSVLRKTKKPWLFSSMGMPEAEDSQSPTHQPGSQPVLPAGQSPIRVTGGGR